MNNRALTKIANTAIRVGKKALPGILVGSGMVVTWISGFEAGLAKPKADKLIAEKKKELGVEKLGPVETVKTTAKVYGKAAAIGAAGAAMTIGGFGVEASRLSTATGLAKAVSDELDTYKTESEKVMTDEQKQEVQQKVDAEKLKKVKKPGRQFQNEIRERESAGVNLFVGFEPLSNLYFSYSSGDVDRAVNEFNRKLVNEASGGRGLSCADWVYTLAEYVKFERQNYKVPSYLNTIGWHRDISGEFSLSPTYQGDWDIPCYVIDPSTNPYDGFERL